MKSLYTHQLVLLMLPSNFYSTNTLKKKTKNKTSKQNDKTFPDLDKEFGALDIDDERDGVVDGHASRPVAFGNKGGEPATPAVPHGEVDDQIEVVFLQVVHDAALFVFGGTLAVVLKRPIHCCNLKQDVIDAL